MNITVLERDHVSDFYDPFHAYVGTAIHLIVCSFPIILVDVLSCHFLPCRRGWNDHVLATIEQMFIIINHRRRAAGRFAAAARWNSGLHILLSSLNLGSGFVV